MLVLPPHLPQSSPQTRPDSSSSCSLSVSCLSLARSPVGKTFFSFPFNLYFTSLTSICTFYPPRFAHPGLTHTSLLISLVSYPHVSFLYRPLPYRRSTPLIPPVSLHFHSFTPLRFFSSVDHIPARPSTTTPAALPIPLHQNRVLQHIMGTEIETYPFVDARTFEEAWIGLRRV